MGLGAGPASTEKTEGSKSGRVAVPSIGRVTSAMRTSRSRESLRTCTCPLVLSGHAASLTPY
jgi:hypothetical protein